MTVWDCFFSASIPHLGSAFPVFILLLFSFSFVTKFYFHLQNTFLKSEEFCLFESYEDGQDISCRSMMFGASRFLWGAPFVFSTKTECLEDGVVHFLTLSFSLSTSQYWPTIGNPDIPDDNDICVICTPRFCLLL